MKKRPGRRRSQLALALGSALLLLFSIACREAKKEEPSAPDASPPMAAAVTAATAAPSESSSAAVGTRAPEPDKEESVDAGTDAGRRKLRRLVAATASGEPVETAPAPPAPAEPTDPRRAAGRPTPAQMANETPYGGSAAGTGAPVLKKTPLPNDDPWARAADGAPR